MEYDVPRGRKIRMIDPDMGEWNYDFDAVGSLREQVSPVEDDADDSTTMAYDLLNRMTSRTDADGTYAWIYDQSPRDGGPEVWLGKLWKVALGGGAYEREHLYQDGTGRPIEVKTLIESELFSTGTDYDTSGRVSTITYPGPSGFAVENVYNTTGYLSQVKNATTGALYWQGNEANYDLKITDEELRGQVPTINLIHDLAPLRPGSRPLQRAAHQDGGTGPAHSGAFPVWSPMRSRNPSW